jgi:mono/diheme cytochrome c family protein
MWLTNLKVGGVALAVIALYTMIAHLIPQLESEVPEALDLTSGFTVEALVEAGDRIYHGAGGCTACHGIGTRAPNLLTDHAGEGPIGTRCGTRGADCKAYLWESMVNPGAHVVGGFDNIMPDMRRQLPEDQIWAVIAYLQSVGGEVTVTAEDIPQAPAAGAASAGPVMTATLDPGTLVREKGCIGCHTLDGQGGPIGPSFDGMGRRLNANQIRRGILDPGAEIAAGFEQFAGTMPTTFGETLTAAQLEALVAFLAGRR